MIAAHEVNAPADLDHSAAHAQQNGKKPVREAVAAAANKYAVGERGIYLQITSAAADWGGKQNVTRRGLYSDTLEQVGLIASGARSCSRGSG